MSIKVFKMKDFTGSVNSGRELCKHINIFLKKGRYIKNEPEEGYS